MIDRSFHDIPITSSVLLYESYHNMTSSRIVGQTVEHKRASPPLEIFGLKNVPVFLEYLISLQIAVDVVVVAAAAAHLPLFCYHKGFELISDWLRVHNLFQMTFYKKQLQRRIAYYHKILHRCQQQMKAMRPQLVLGLDYVFVVDDNRTHCSIVVLWVVELASGAVYIDDDNDDDDEAVVSATEELEHNKPRL
ncbi:hypothetical protein GQX74_001911 [Glossina fuscipes]|nr:hypothetical protein GQX74_001911 [Glossina fuscipes]